MRPIKFFLNFEGGIELAKFNEEFNFKRRVY